MTRSARLLIGAIVLLAFVAGILGAYALGEDDTAADPTSPPASASSPAATAPPPSESPSTPVPTASPTTSPATPSPAPTPTAYARPTRVLPVGAAITPTADGLRIRSFPSTDGDIQATVSVGDILYIQIGENPWLPPRIADGYEWYPVMYAPGYEDWPLEPAESRVSGWLAARSDSESFVELMTPECPTSIDNLSALVALTPYERIACLGDEQVTVEGTFGCPFCDSLVWPFAQEPAWLAQWTHHLSMLVPSWANYPPFPGRIVLVTPPDVSGIGREVRGSVLRVTGHFDDVRARDCRITPDTDAGAAPVDDEAAEWYCRERLVVESWEVIGTDPAYADLIPG